MNAGEAVREVERYLARPVDVDELRGPYGVRGVFMDDPGQTERLEVGRAGRRDYRPLLQLQVDPPAFDDRKRSYLDSDDDFSGTAYGLSRRDFRDAEKIRRAA